MNSKYELYENDNYYVTSVVCDYGIYCKYEDKLILIMNSFNNAVQIAKILDIDVKKGSV